MVMPKTHPLSPCLPHHVECKQFTRYELNQQGEPIAWEGLRLRAANLTSLWSSCPVDHYVPNRVPAGLMYLPKHNVWIPPIGSSLSRMLRPQTWEDGLNVSACLPPSTARLFGVRRETGPCIGICHYLPLPLSVGTTQRPARGFFARPAADVAFFALGIEKCASSTWWEFFRRFALQLNASTPNELPVYRAWANRTHLDLIEEVEKRAYGEPVARPCGSGQAATFDLDDPGAARTFKFATVRDPLDRFIAAFQPHSGGRGWSEANIDAIVSELAARARSLRLASSDASPSTTYRDIDQHYRTQSFYLTSTNAAGHSVTWDAIVRLEELADLGEQIAREMLLPAASTDRLAATAVLSHQPILPHGEPIAPRLAGSTWRMCVALPTIPFPSLRALYPQALLCLGCISKSPRPSRRLSRRPSRRPSTLFAGNPNRARNGTLDVLRAKSLAEITRTRHSRVRPVPCIRPRLSLPRLPHT